MIVLTRQSRGAGIARWLNVTTLGLVVAGGALVVSLGRVLTIQEQILDPGRKIIRISHIQLELGYREALQDVIDEYEKLHANVTIKQIYMNGRVYNDWLQTQLISGTGPDIAELGSGKLGSDTHYLPRYFLPLSDLAEQPNPYNTDNEMAAWPWRKTFIDGMRGGYRYELQEYFSVPTCMWTIRLYYNKDILRRATGSDHAPRTLGEMFDMCRKIKTYARRTGRGDSLVPIAGNRTNGGRLIRSYELPFTAGLEPLLDLDLDGRVGDSLYDRQLSGSEEFGGWEAYVAFLRGEIGFDHPNIRGYYELGREIARQFNEGFMSLDREDGVFMFIQQRAVMICSGSWNTHGLTEQADFEVGVFDCPLPAPGERWADLVAGRGNEAVRAGAVLYGVYKHSNQVDQAIDFIQFLTSRRINERFNQRASWLPIVVGAEPSQRMVPFMPDPRGFASKVSLAFGVHVRQVINGQMWRFVSGEIEYEELARVVEAAIRHPMVGGDKNWVRQYDDARRWCRDQERILAGHSIRTAMGPQPDRAANKYRRALLQQIRFNNGNDIRHRFETLRHRSIDPLID